MPQSSTVKLDELEILDPTSEELSKLAHSAGLSISSTKRTPQKQQELIKQGKTKATQSLHLSGSAIDVLGPPEKRKKFTEEVKQKYGSSITETIDEGDHTHIGWKGSNTSKVKLNELEFVDEPKAKGKVDYSKERAARTEKFRGQMFKPSTQAKDEELTPAEKALPVVGPLLGRFRKSIPGRVVTTAAEGVGLPLMAESVKALVTGGMGIGQAKYLFETVKGMGQQQWDEYTKFRDLLDKRVKEGKQAPITAALSDPEIAQHLLAAIVPMVGPYASSAVEDLKAGRTTEGLTKAGVILAPFGLKAIGKLRGKGVGEIPTKAKAVEAPEIVDDRLSPTVPATGAERAEQLRMAKEGEEFIAKENLERRKAAATTEIGRQIAPETAEAWREMQTQPTTKPGFEEMSPEERAQVKKAAEQVEPSMFEEPAVDPRSSSFGEKNTIVSKTEAEAIKARLKERLKTQRGSGGPSTEDLIDYGKLAVHYIEGGLREFSTWSKVMIEDFGETIRPHLNDIWARAQREIQQREIQRTTETPKGAGAAPIGFKPPGAEITQLGEAAKASVEAARQAGEKPSDLTPLPRTPLGIGARIKSASQSAKTTLSNIWQNYKAGPAKPITSVEAESMNLYAQHQKINLEAKQFASTIKEAVPDQVRRDAIFRYAAANGDATVLQDWATKSTNPRAKVGYENALKLTDTEKTIAENFMEFFRPLLKEGMDAGVIHSAIDDYVTQIVKKGPKGSKLAKMMDSMSADAQAQLLNPNFRFGRQRVFPNIFEGEQAGYVYDTDFASAATTYYSSMGRAIASRKFLKNLQGLVATDGRPAVSPSGSGRPVGQSILIRPDAKWRRGVDIGDYKPIDHWAFKGWKWLQDVSGTDLMMQGDLLVHPEFFDKAKARFEQSKVQQYKLGRGALAVQAFGKGTMFSLSPFHLVTEATHAIGHTVNPFSHLPKLDTTSAGLMEGLRGGLQLAGGHGQEMFSEGLSGKGGLVGMVPGLGKFNAAWTNWLFQDYIPRLKYKTYQHILERNSVRYGKKLTREQLTSLSADQANAAYGELNYFKLGRSKTMQDVSRLMLLAPDFLEARARFVGQASKGFGREQMRALVVLAGTQYVAARIANELGHGNAETSLERMFQVKAGDKWWGIRSVPGDMLHLASDWRGFINWRLNPIMVTTPMEALSGTEFRSPGKDIGKGWIIKKGKTLPQVLGSALERTTPLPTQGLTRQDVDLLDSMLQSIGVVQMRGPKPKQGKKKKAIGGVGGIGKIKF